MRYQERIKPVKIHAAVFAVNTLNKGENVCGIAGSLFASNHLGSNNMAVGINATHNDQSRALAGNLHFEYKTAIGFVACLDDCGIVGGDFNGLEIFALGKNFFESRIGQFVLVFLNNGGGNQIDTCKKQSRYQTDSAKNESGIKFAILHSHLPTFPKGVGAQSFSM